MAHSPTLKIEEIQAISNGFHGDPFAILGLHYCKNPASESADSESAGHATARRGSDRLVVRTLRPDAASVRMLNSGGAPIDLVRISDEGLFEAVIAPGSETGEEKYRLEVTPLHGEPYSIVDAWQFGPLLDEFDLQLWGEGSHQQCWRWMGAHPRVVEGVSGTHFVVAAPDAKRVSVIGSFNSWDSRVHPMRRYPAQGVWEIFIPHVAPGDLYKFDILPASGGEPLQKSDPYAFLCELRPATASVVWKGDYRWGDREWMESRHQIQAPDQPLSIYEIHAGSWRRDDTGSFLNYRTLAEELIPWLGETGFTHVELMPVAEHPYDPSWGYQLTGYYATTRRYGTPDDFRYFVDRCHQAGIGVILDWVPGHFASDAHGLRMFDGSALYEHADPRQGEHADWGTLIFNYGRTEVINFLISNALFWLEEFHIDGLRVDAVASMLYLDYSREEGEWIPNQYGGRENLEAIEFLRRFNRVVHEQYPGVLTMAEESTSWPGVTQPEQAGGLGFGIKWNMGWMNDNLVYMARDPIYRRYHQGQLTFSLIYAFNENFLLPLSHDEVVHLKGALLSKMPGDDWQKFANLRLLYTWMFSHPGKKLLFMGGEFGQWGEWDHDHAVDWHLLQWEMHRGVKLLVSDLNRLYREEPALHELDYSAEGFEWIDMNDADNSIISFIRKDRNGNHRLIVLNFTPVVHHDYKVGIPHFTPYRTLFNSDSHHYGGSNTGSAQNDPYGEAWHGRPAHIRLTVPPLGGLILAPSEPPSGVPDSAEVSSSVADGDPVSGSPDSAEVSLLGGQGSAEQSSRGGYRSTGERSGEGAS